MSSNRMPTRPPRRGDDEIQRPETTLEHFSYAMDVMQGKVGNLYDCGAKFWISQNVHTALFLEFDNIKIGIPYTLFGIPVEIASHMDGMECSLSGKGAQSFRFTIPETGTVEALPERTKPKPKSSYGISPIPSLIFWDFIKQKWQSQDDYNRSTNSYLGCMFLFIFWVFSGIFAEVISIVFLIPHVILSLIGIMILVQITKYQVRKSWDKYSPEYQEFKQAKKPKGKTNGEQMATLGELFEGYEDKRESTPPPFYPKFRPPGEVVRR